MLTKADVSSDMPQMRFEIFCQKLVVEIAELEQHVRERMYPDYVRPRARPLDDPSEWNMTLNGWMLYINNSMDRRNRLKEQLEFLEGNTEMNWAKLWERLNKELP